MQLTVVPIKTEDRSIYEEFLENPKNKPHKTFFHTWEWGEFMQSNSKIFIRFGIYQNKKIVGIGQCMLKKLKVGSYWYCPRGLVLDYNDHALVTAAYNEVRRYFNGKNDAGFLRVDPDIVRGDSAEKNIDELKPKQAYIFSQAERVWIVDLQDDENSLLDWLKSHGMRKKLPYYLRRAAKEGVKIRASSDSKDLEILISMLNDLDSRKGGIGKFHDDYYRKQFKYMAPKGYEKVFLAEKDGRVLAASLVGLYGKEGSYLHAASSDEMRSLSAPHLLQFEVMKYIQKELPDAVRYNFWGIVSDKNRNTNHPRNGYSEFKRSFGGYKLEYIRARDFVYKPLVWRIAWFLDVYRTYRFKND